MSNSGEMRVDFDALIHYSDDFTNSFDSPSMSPSSGSKATFASPMTAAVPTSSVSTTSQTMSGPSHNYGMYPQQTGFVPGAIAHTMAMNQTNNTGYQDLSSLDYLSASLSPETEGFNFNASPSQPSIDFDVEPQTDSQQFLSTVDPSNIEQASATLSQSSNVGRLWPGAHSQAALARAQSQQRQQQQQQQQAAKQQQQSQRSSSQKSRTKAPQASDSIVEEKISQVLSSMRASLPGLEADSATFNVTRTRKDDEDMDEDERLLASEEGKKLTSKERRQLRNKVSARAFRSRRKEYISQLEAEIASKVNENGDLKSQNRALLEENKRLTDLSRMLLSSPSFSNFLEHLSSNPAAVPQTAPVKVEQSQQQEQNQIPKDVNPYNGQTSSQQQIGMAMIPEATVEYPLLGPDHSGYNFQPQVFMVDRLETSSAIDITALTGKTSNFVEDSSSSSEKVELPALERSAESKPAQATHELPVDDEFEADPEFALFHTEPVVVTELSQDLDTENLAGVDVFGGIGPEKLFARVELVDTEEEEASAAFAMARVQRISASIDSVVSRLERLTVDL